MRFRDFAELARPFEILKLIRDGLIQSAHDLGIPDSLYYHFSSRVFDGLTEVGFIQRDAEGNLKPTERLRTFLESLDLSLTRLSPYHSEAIVCSPMFKLPSKPPKESDVFVLMPFPTEMRPVYDKHIKNVSAQLGLTVTRADDFFAAESIVTDVWNAINNAKILIADCTGRNPNVFYEIGIAHTLGKPVVLLSQRASDIPFDVQHIRAIVYKFSPRGMVEFETKLRATIEFELSYVRSLEECLRTSPSEGDDD
jgi:hypothetical protein